MVKEGREIKRRTLTSVEGRKEGGKEVEIRKEKKKTLKNVEASGRREGSRRKLKKGRTLKDVEGGKDEEERCRKFEGS